MSRKKEIVFDKLQKVIDEGYTLENVLERGIEEIMYDIEFAEHYEKLKKENGKHD